MKSNLHAGQAKLRGKKSLPLSCGCCEVSDLREQHAKKYAYRDLQYALKDDYPRVEVLADGCTPETPCELCRAAAARAQNRLKETDHAC